VLAAASAKRMPTRSFFIAFSVYAGLDSRQYNTRELSSERRFHSEASGNQSKDLPVRSTRPVQGFSGELAAP